MRIHVSKTVTTLDIFDAARVARVNLLSYSEHGSRKRGHAYEVALSGDGAHRTQWGSREDPAATWDQWGIFLAELFKRDPDMTILRVYADAADFHWQTGNRFKTLTHADQHKRHRWSYAYSQPDGSRTAITHRCTATDCTATRNFYL